MVGFVSNIELLAEISKMGMRTKFQDIEVTVNEWMKKTFDQLNEWGTNQLFFYKESKTKSVKKSNNLKYEDKCIEDSEEADTSTQFLRNRKNKLIDLN